MEAARLFAHPLRAWSLPNTVTGPQTPGRPFSRCSTSASRESRALNPLSEGGPWKIFPSLFSASPTQSHPLPKATAKGTLPQPPTPPFRMRISSAAPYTRPINDPKHSAPSSHPGRRQTSPGGPHRAWRLAPGPLTWSQPPRTIGVPAGGAPVDSQGLCSAACPPGPSLSVWGRFGGEQTVVATMKPEAQAGRRVRGLPRDLLTCGP